MNEIKKTVLEQAIKNLDNNYIKQILNDSSLNFAIEILTVDKNFNLLCKKTNFQFLSTLYTDLNNLSKNRFMQFLKITNEKFIMEQHPILTSDNDKNKLNAFIVKSIDMSISKSKKYSLEDIEQVIKIGKKYKIKNEKIVTWMGKMFSHSNNPNILPFLKKEPLLIDSKNQERFISVVLNKSNNPILLDSVFEHYESKIYEVYSKYKSDNTIWNFLLPIKNWAYEIPRLPYVVPEKLDWFENKHLGYNNNSTPFKLLNVFFEINSYKGIENNEELFEFISNENYQNLIYNAVIDYKRNMLPIINDALEEFSKENEKNTIKLKFKYSDQYKKIEEQFDSNSYHAILFIFHKDKKVFDFCEKVNLKIEVEDSISNCNSTHTRKTKKI